MVEQEPNSILAVRKGLPPGLWLPTAEESTDRFLVATFNHGNHQPEDIVELGMFAVALLVVDSAYNNSKRVSMMPTREDFRDLYTAGYGVNTNHFQNTYGGAPHIHEALGFYTKHTLDPTPTELIHRLRWLSRYSLKLDVEFPEQNPRVRQILKWGADRHLLPPVQVVKETLDNYAPEVRRIFSVEIPRYKEQNTFADAYRLGARVVRDKGKAITESELNKDYADACVGRPSAMIRTLFGSYSKFWHEFDLFEDSFGVTEDDLVNIGVRYAIRTGDTHLTRVKINALSSQQRFPSASLIARRLQISSLDPYRQRVAKGYSQYMAIRHELEQNGVSAEVSELACHRFEIGPSFSEKLIANQEVLIKISQNSYHAEYVRYLIKTGFNLLDEEIYDMQIADLKAVTKRLGIARKSASRLIVDLIPCVNTDELLAAA